MTDAFDARPASALRFGAGSSAAAEADRRRARQQVRLHAERVAHPILGRARQALHPEVDAGASWAKGAEGERFLGARFDADAVAHGDLTVLHDRRIPGSKAKIDHLVVGPGGVWVVDAKAHRGVVRHVDLGGWLRSDWRLTVGGRDRTNLVAGVTRQVEVVREVLAGTPEAGVPVRGALCFVSGQFGWRFRPFELEDVTVTWPKAIRSLVRADGPIDAARRAWLAVWLGERLRAA